MGTGTLCGERQIDGKIKTNMTQGSSQVDEETGKNWKVALRKFGTNEGKLAGEQIESKNSWPHRPQQELARKRKVESSEIKKRLQVQNGLAVTPSVEQPEFLVDGPTVDNRNQA